MNQWSPSDGHSQEVAGERRGNPRRPTIAVFSLRFDSASVIGAGKDVSEEGAYLITSDELNSEVAFELEGSEVKIPARIVRVDKISSGTVGIALRFDRPMPGLKT